jgi:hypothetical protein
LKGTNTLTLKGETPFLKGAFGPTMGDSLFTRVKEIIEQGA